ncbi:MAG: hypothetical protein M1832_000960 [Thelocarpon impressellum]|nr:MAG: hypothetical protein M1832_000960 [Thelocarpon impressellum]
MHILVINDDGPPSTQSSPYVHSLVVQLQTAGHTVSVVLPHTQRSWIGKAHIVGATITPTYFRPGTLHADDGTTHARPLPPGSGQEEWILVDGTPASCAQIGLHHFFRDRGPVELVVSGPNYGRNTTAVFGLSSGTLGGALEAAVCGTRAIALSYAFFSQNHDPEIIAGASRISVRLIEHLAATFADSVDVYSVNVPLVPGVEGNKVVYTHMLQNYWTSGSSFAEADVEDEGPVEREAAIREAEAPAGQEARAGEAGHRHRQFTWAPRFADVYKSVEGSAPGNDGRAVQEGFTSVTPLQANFMHAPGFAGEIRLPLPPPPREMIYAVVAPEDDYLHPLLLSALEKYLNGRYTLLPSPSSLPHLSSPLLQISAYEALSFPHILAHPATSLANSYVIRKALIRKHFLADAVHAWVTKNPGSALRGHFKQGVALELDYAEFLDEALLEAYELHESFARNEARGGGERGNEEYGNKEKGFEELEEEANDRERSKEWWILKPSMADRGQGIRLFSSEAELRGIFEGWEEDLPPSPSASDDGDDGVAKGEGGDGIMTSQLRHFVAQPYIHPPLLTPPSSEGEGGPKKFHVRTYVLAAGALRVWVYREMLALFASAPYTAPGEGPLSAHLTNTCLQDGSHEGSVKRFWALPSSLPSLPPTWKEGVFAQICNTTSETFLAAARGGAAHFQPLPNAFEVFGLDFLVDSKGLVWLLEVNAFPDYKQTGEELREVVGGLWEGVVQTAVLPFFFPAEEEKREKREGEKGNDRMVQVLDIDLGLR